MVYESTTMNVQRRAEIIAHQWPGHKSQCKDARANVIALCVFVFICLFVPWCICAWVLHDEKTRWMASDTRDTRKHKEKKRKQRKKEQHHSALFIITEKVCACVHVCVCVCVCVCQRKTKDRADGMREKVPIALDGIRTCISGIRAHRASDCTTTAGTPPVSRNKHFRHSPVSSIVKQSVCVCECVCVCVCVCVTAPHGDQIAFNTWQDKKAASSYWAQCRSINKYEEFSEFACASNNIIFVNTAVGWLFRSQLAWPCS